MTFTDGAANPHDQGVVLVETPGSVEHEQVLRLLVHLKLVEGVIQVDDAVSVRPCKIVSELLWCGNWKVRGLDLVLPRAGVQVDPYLFICPALLSDHHVMYPSPG